MVTLKPARLLDLESTGTGADLQPLRARYPDTRMIGLDRSAAMLALAAERTPLAALAARRAGRQPERAGARRHRPAADRAAQHGYGVVQHGAALKRARPAAGAARVQRCVRVGGLFMFSMLGPDTLRELRAALDAAGLPGRVHRFIDMHDVGDMLVEAGFAELVDMEHITLTFEAASGRIIAIWPIPAATVRWRRVRAA